MKLLSSLFFCAMALSSASAAASVTGAGSCMPWRRAMARGTMLSMSARREASPITDSMWLSSASLRPMWRATNSLAFSSASKGMAEGMSMAGLGGGSAVVVDELLVGRLVHHGVELRHVLDQHLEEPALAQRVAVGQRGVG